MKRVAIVILFTLLAWHVQAAGSGQRADILLTTAAPESTKQRTTRSGGISTIRYINRRGVLATTQWPLILRLESRTAVGFVAKRALDQEREALVLTDPDECFHLGSLVDDLSIVPPAIFDPVCAFEDESYIELQTERNDTFGEPDNDTTGNDAIRNRLVDEPFGGAPPLNTPYLTMANGNVQPVGPRTQDPSGTVVSDGYGYGTDDDCASCVIMVDFGGARVFDENFNLVPGVIRNMAGLINTVGAEDVDGRRQTAVTVSMHVLAGVFEPIAYFDTDTDDPAFDYAIRVDSGPIVGVNLTEPLPPDPLPDPSAANAFIDEVLSLYYPAEFTLRAVIVHGEAPSFIYDMDGDGKYTARDVELAGFTLVSNEVEINLEVTHENLLIESSDPKCEPRTLVHGDVDGNGSAGLFPDCVGTSGATRGRRVQR